MTIQDSVLTHVGAIKPYAPGKPISHVAREHSLDPQRIVKLASNENPLGMSPVARQALIASAAEGHRYPDMDCVELREVLAKHLNISMDTLLVGAGSSELIVLAARAFLDSQRAALVPQYSFVSYESAVRSVGARTIVVPGRGWHPDLGALRAAIDPAVKVLFIASPNNPTGVLVEPQALEEFIAGVPEDVLVVLDEAYRDYVEPGLCTDTAALIARHPNLLVLRTFSKVYGLAALRIGYGLGNPAMLSMLRRLQPPFSVNATAQTVAMAALSDREFRARCIEVNRAERDQLCRSLAALNIEYVPSHGNFVLVRVGDGNDVFRTLLKRGVIVRPLLGYHLPEWVRVTVGRPEENAVFLRNLREVLTSR